MAETIKGINVMIGSDTTGLSAALSDVNKSSREIQGELSKVERLLKFNPKDTQLLAQKQKLLGDQVATTREKLDRLKSAQAQVNEQFKAGKISEGQYRAFQREVIETESKLKHFETQLKNTGSSVEELGKKMQAASEKLDKTGKTLTKTVSAPIAIAGAAAFKMAADMEDAMGATEQVFDSAANTVKDWARNLESYYGIAETEALEYSNMMGSMLQNIGGLTEEQAAKQAQTLIELAGDLTAMYGGTTADAVRALTGALKGNNTMLDNYGMAVNDAMIKTKAYEMGLYTGTGQMDLATKQAASLALVMEQSGAAQGQAAREAKGASGSMRDLVTGLKNLATSFRQILLPVITPFITRLGEMVKWLKDLDPSIKQTIVLIAGMALAIGPLLIGLAKITMAVKALIPLFVAANAPIAIAAVAIGGLVLAINHFSSAQKRAIEETQKAITAHEDQIDSVTDLIAEYEQLTKKTNKTNEEKERLIELSNKIADVIPGAVAAYDAEGNALIDLNLALVQTVNLKRDEMALRAKDLDLQIKQAEKKKRIAEDEKKRLEKNWALMQQRMENWGGPEQQRLNELTAEYNREMVKANNEVSKSVRELNDLQAEQEEIAKLTEKVTIEYVKNEIAKKNNEVVTKTLTAAEEKLAAAQQNQTQKTAEQIKAAEELAKKRVAFETQWNDRLLDLNEQYSLSRTQNAEQEAAAQLEILERQKQEALAEAEELHAGTKDILDYYALEEQKILDKKVEAYAQSLEKTGMAYLGFIQTVAEGSKSFKDAAKEMVITIISALQQQIVAAAAAASAWSYAMAAPTFGGSLAHLAVIAAKVTPQILALEALKAGIRGLAEGALATGPTLAVIGEKKGTKEAVLPLTQSVLADIGKGIVAAMPQQAGGQGLTVNLNIHGNVIGDKQGMRKLAQEVFSYEYSVKRRLGGAEA